MAVDYTTDVGKVRLLINDTNEADAVFSDAEIGAFLAMEGDNVKRGAAQALDTIADDEALTSKVLKDHETTTDGAKVADSLRKRAAALRAQADEDEDNSDDGAYFDIVPMGDHCNPELTGTPVPGWWI